MKLSYLNKKSKIMIAMVIAILLLLSTFYFVGFVYGSYIGVENYSVREITVQDNILHLTGTTNSSGQAYSGYSYKVKDENVYIKIRYSLVSTFNQSGEANIVIEDNFKDVENVYLQGSKRDDNRLIWSRER
ncbi:MAG: hypothetical protein LRY71_06460 [Bacillaceae bacterium]|nr:hypothetical protein [Bacillaceae bacterium]